MLVLVIVHWYYILIEKNIMPILNIIQLNIIYLVRDSIINLMYKAYIFLIALKSTFNEAFSRICLEKNSLNLNLPTLVLKSIPLKCGYNYIVLLYFCLVMLTYITFLNR